MTRTAIALASAILLVAACTTPSASTGTGGATGPAATGTGSSQAAGGTIKIGGGFALTGAESALDLPAANGAKLAVKQINAAGGVNGQQIDFIVHDSKYDMAVTAQTAKQFVEQDKVPLFIGYTDTDSVLASGPTFQNAKIPFITVGATSPKIPTQVGDMMFLACFGDNVQAAVGAEYSYDTFGHNAYFLWDKGDRVHDAPRRATSRPASRSSAARSPSRTRTTTTRPTSPPRSRRSRPSSPQPDFYYVAAMPYNIGPLVKQFRDAGHHRPDRRWRRLRHAGPRERRRRRRRQRVLHDPCADGCDRRHRRHQEVHRRLQRPSTATIRRTRSRPSATTPSTCSSTRSSAPAAPIRRRSRQPSRAPRTSRASRARSRSRADTHVPQKGVTMIAVEGGKFTLGAEVVPEKVPAP